MTIPDHAATRRRRRIAAAGHTGDLQGAVAGLDDPDPAVRASALGALGRCGALTATQIDIALQDGAPAVRIRAAELAVGLGATAAAMLVGLLTDPEPGVVEAACFALGELGEGAADPAFVRILARVAADHPDPLCRETAVAALGAIGEPAGLPAVLAATSDKPPVRRRAVLSLAAFDGPEVDEALERALGDRDWQVRQAAEDLLGRTR